MEVDMELENVSITYWDLISLFRKGRKGLKGDYTVKLPENRRDYPPPSTSFAPKDFSQKALFYLGGEVKPFISVEFQIIRKKKNYYFCRSWKIP